MFTLNGQIHKMLHPRISETSCQKCKARLTGATTIQINFHCKKCGQWYCFACGIGLDKCPECGSKLE